MKLKIFQKDQLPTEIAKKPDQSDGPEKSDVPENPEESEEAENQEEAENPEQAEEAEESENPDNTQGADLSPLLDYIRIHNLSVDCITDLLDKGLDYENAIERARIEGEITGRNAVITANLEDSDSDGVPALGGSSNSAPRNNPSSIFDLAGFAR